MAHPSRTGKTSISDSQQDVLNSSFDQEFGILTVGVLGWTGSAFTAFKVNAQGELIVDTGGGELAVNVQTNSGDSNVKYIGQAAIGTATSAASWQIMKIDKTTGTVITYADGDDSFNNVFDNRESLSYE